MTRAVAVANSIIDNTTQFDISDLTHLKLQKLLYLFTVKYVKEYEHLPFPEDFQAWRYGPIVKEVYDEFKSNGSNVILLPGMEKINDDEVSEIINKTLKDYGQLRAWDLVELTHKPNSAWDKAFRSNNNTIDLEDIKNEKFDE